MMRRSSIRRAAMTIEALAGTGDLEDARTLIGDVLTHDKSEATRAMLKERLERAGHPELLPDEKAPPAQP